ncbi:type VI secretion system contractile sheath small subunit [Acidimangrovimonas sediminis]|uniref:type VI secretion system contractile sheath small subunit n=1 Tax=Acidimangrovimonas sediminis TaxID=2056283 RepID=UPI000C80A785|nr:type VI secretion system contractile sheath small subunit [Acidimangrovimonas sediminis]
MSNSGSKFIKRNRPPRVQIAYADPYDSTQNVELPFVMGVMSDLSGNASDKEKPKIAERDFTNVDTENFDDFMSSVEPAVSMTVKNKLSGAEDENLSVKLTFKSMNDLDPGEIARQVPALRKLLEARSQLANLQRYMNGKAGAQEMLNKLLSDDKLMAMLSSQTGDAADKDGDSA